MRTLYRFIDDSMADSYMKIGTQKEGIYVTDIMLHGIQIIRF